MSGEFGKKSNPYMKTPGAGQFGKKSKIPNAPINYPKEEIEETIGDSTEDATVEEIESIEEVMNKAAGEVPEEPKKDTN